MSTTEATTADNQSPENVEDVEFVDMAFTKELRKATKDVHNLTDVLVNAKFALGGFTLPFLNYICIIICSSLFPSPFR